MNKYKSSRSNSVAEVAETSGEQGQMPELWRVRLRFHTRFLELLKSLLILLIPCLLFGCAGKSGPQHSAGPYYYMSAPSREGYELPGDLSQEEAREVGARGLPYYVAYFDTKGKPDKILKVSAGETEVLKE